jgi:hypothetical protein
MSQLSFPSSGSGGIDRRVGGSYLPETSDPDLAACKVALFHLSTQVETPNKEEKNLQNPILFRNGLSA